LAINLSITDGWLISLIGKRKRRYLFVTISILFIGSSFLILNNKKVESVDPLFTLNFKTIDEAPYPEYAYLIKQQLKRIGINVEIEIQNWGDFIDSFVVYHDFDIISIGYYANNLRNFFYEIYSENGSANYLGYDTEMDFDESLGTGKNEWYIQEINNYIPPSSQERYELCWEWQNYLMDKILPLLPLFVTEGKMYYYNNLVGYNYQDGLLQSWGKLSWNGLHEGQLSQEEVVYADIVDGIWSPFFYADSPREADYFIIDCIMDSLFWRDSDQTYWPHIVEDWTYLENNHLRLKLREGIKWQSDPENNFTNEYLDAEDIYFSLYCYKNIGVKYSDWFWLEDFNVVDSYTIDLIIGNDYYPENNLYNNYLDDLSQMNIVPEHYLNQSQLIDGITPDITHPSWITFIENPFGTGLFKFEQHTQFENTIISVNPESWWLNSSITNDESLNWQNRFGDYSNSPNSLRIRNDLYDSPYEELIEFTKGNIDLYSSNNYPPDSNWLEDNMIGIQTIPSNFFRFIGFNLRSIRDYIGNQDISEEFPEMTRGLLIRKAIVYAINREEINEVIYGGEARMINYPFSPIFGKWCDPNIMNYCHNLVYAKYFMCAAGYDRGGRWIDYPPGFPDWEYACSDFSPSTVDVNSSYYLGFLGLIGVIIFKRRRNKLKK
jgi:ABC-type transport system substrate-binding protein